MFNNISVTMSFTNYFPSKMPQIQQPPEGNNFGQFTTIKSMQGMYIFRLI